MIEVGDSIEVPAGTVALSVTEASSNRVEAVAQVGRSVETMSANVITGLNEAAGKVGSSIEAASSTIGVDAMEVFVRSLKDFILLVVLVTSIISLIFVGFTSGNVHGVRLAVLLFVLSIMEIMFVVYEMNRGWLASTRGKQEKESSE